MLLSIRPDNRDDDSLVFTTPRGKPIDVHNFRNRAWGKMLENLGIPYRKPYNTRRTFASQALEQGLSPLTVSEMTGHDVDVLYKHYAGSIANAPRLPEMRGSVERKETTNQS